MNQPTETEHEMTVLEQRGTRYGIFREQASVSDALVSVLENSRNWGCMPQYMRESMRMICTKMGRCANGDYSYDDNWVDICGYAELCLTALQEDNWSDVPSETDEDPCF